MIVVYATTSIHSEEWAVFDSEEVYSACADALDTLAKQSRMDILTCEVEKDLEKLLDDGHWCNTMSDIRTQMMKEN